MSRLPVYYPPANHTAQWKPGLAAGGPDFTKVEKLLLHSTETKNWPGYPTFAPHLTLHVGGKDLWHQHLPLYRGATTLADPSWTSVRENRDNVIQVEIVGYAKTLDKTLSASGDRGYKALGLLAKWLHEVGGMPLTSTVKWVAYPESYGLHAKQRLSGPAFDKYTGILGHEHASGNDHGDPGLINIHKLLSYAQPKYEHWVVARYPKGKTYLQGYKVPSGKPGYRAKIGHKINVARHGKWPGADGVMREYIVSNRNTRYRVDYCDRIG